MVLAVSVVLILILGVVPEFAVRLTGAGRLRMEITPTATGLPPADRVQIVNAAERIR
jgi:hypothetical protein